MIAKCVILLSAVAAALGGVLQLAGHGDYSHGDYGHGDYGHGDYGHEAVAHAPAQLAYAGHEDHAVDYHAHPKYDYSYSVSDPHTGDHKTQHEARDGDVVKGEYSLLQPDGSFRKVTYTADDHNGFNAIVHNTAPVIHDYHH